jgi:hypothetical protein
MSEFPILDLVIGVIFIFFLLSIICSSVVEMIMTAFQLRSKYLARWIRVIFDPKFAVEIMNHSSVTALSRENKAPAYIHSSNFVTAMLDRITYHEDLSKIPVDLKDYVQFIKENEHLKTRLKRQLLVYANEANDIAKLNPGTSELIVFRKKLEQWYDTSMERVSGRLKVQYARPLTFGVACIAVFLLNADAIVICKYLYRNPEARRELRTGALSAVDDSALKVAVSQIKTGNGLSAESARNLDSLQTKVINDLAVIKNANMILHDSIPVGWHQNEFRVVFASDNYFLLLSKLLGLLATILAIMIGAPFWFDVLNRISNIRGNGRQPEKHLKEVNILPNNS